MAKHDGQACERYAWLSNRISIVTEIIKNPEMLLWNQISLSIYLRGVLHFCWTKRAKHDTDYKTLKEKTFLTVILKTRRDERQKDGRYPLLEGRLNWSFRENSGNLVYSKVRGLLFHCEVRKWFSFQRTLTFLVDWLTLRNFLLIL